MYKLLSGALLFCFLWGSQGMAAGPRWPSKDKLSPAELKCFYNTVVFRGEMSENAALECFGLNEAEITCVASARAAGHFVQSAYQACGIIRPDNFFDYNGF